MTSELRAVFFRSAYGDDAAWHAAIAACRRVVAGEGRSAELIEEAGVVWLRMGAHRSRTQRPRSAEAQAA